MSEISIESLIVDEGVNIQQLQQTEFGNEAYYKMAEQVKGTLTQTYVIDVDDIFIHAYAKLEPNEEQYAVLLKFQESLIGIEEKIDPDRLTFSITKAVDDEICINRNASSGGRVKIIIHDDGLIAYSFIPEIGNHKPKELSFYESDTLDFEGLSYQFLSA